MLLLYSQNQGAARSHLYVATGGSAKSVFIHLAVLSHYSPLAFLDFHLLRLIAAVEHQFNFLPSVAVGMVKY